MVRERTIIMEGRIWSERQNILTAKIEQKGYKPRTANSLLKLERTKKQIVY